PRGPGGILPVGPAHRGALPPRRAAICRAKSFQLSKKPFPVELKAGKKYAWCACGHSKNQPFCDGAHKKAAPGISPLRFIPEEDKTVWLCGCKRTRSPPYCDGTHKEEAVQRAQLSAQP
uniref:Iron-binding zinc finger CDGSH type domain-containing protein n=1 Tax=Aquila chrysaetos chrysaetos TaxID=223781 RepID=A0A663E4I3_AQUCH